MCGVCGCDLWDGMGGVYQIIYTCADPKHIHRNTQKRPKTHKVMRRFGRVGKGAAVEVALPQASGDGKGEGGGGGSAGGGGGGLLGLKIEPEEMELTYVCAKWCGFNSIINQQGRAPVPLFPPANQPTFPSSLPSFTTSVLHEDEWLVAVSKPPGLVVQPCESAATGA